MFATWDWDAKDFRTPLGPRRGKIPTFGKTKHEKDKERGKDREKEKERDRGEDKELELEKEKVGLDVVMQD